MPETQNSNLGNLCPTCKSDSAKVKAQNRTIQPIMSSGYWRINPVSIMGAAIALISVFLPWWGIYEIVGSNGFAFRQWTLWNPPGATVFRRIGQPQPVSAASISQTFTISSLLVLVLALTVAALALAGSLTLLRKYLTAGLILSIITPIVYTVALAYTTSNYCLLSPLCLSGPIGTGSAFGTTFTWGFETGFYFFLVSTAVLALAIVLNNSLARSTARKEVTIPARQAA